MPRSSVAVAVFVKTFGISPVKTRLARTVGEAFATQFYRLSVDCIEEVVQVTAVNAGGGVMPYWAVAEADQVHAERWRALPVVTQLAEPGMGGGLGERLDTVYRTLLDRHAGVLLIGADSPHLPAHVLQRAATLLRDYDWVMGRSNDGGFYLFGGRKKVDTSIWTSVTYSAERTADELVAALGGEPAPLPTTFDVDTVDELLLLEEELRRAAPVLLPKQKLLSTFLTERSEEIRAAARAAKA